MTPADRYNTRKEIARRRKARAERQRRERRKLLLRLAAVAIVAVLAGWLIFSVSNRQPNTSVNNPQPIQTQPSDPQQTEYIPQEPQTVIHIAAGGDLNVTDQMLEYARTADGYDFTNAFLDVAPILSGADLALLNFEGNLSGSDYGTDTGSAPMELPQALKAAGVDGVQTANSATIRKGVLGLQDTLTAMQQAGLTPIGTFADAAAFRRNGGYTIFEVKGIRIAVVAFTKGMDNLGLPKGSEDCVNLLYTDYATDYKKVDTKGINAILADIREEQPDLTIAMLHWGSEYTDEISSTQKTIKRLMLEGGVDVIVGSHPHLVQTIDYDSVAGTLVAYSLGDFFGDGVMAGSNYSIILDLEVTRDNATGEVYLSGYSYTPIYTLAPEQSTAGGHRVVRIAEAMARYDTGYLGRITQSTYGSMEYALTRITERVNTKVG